MSAYPENTGGIISAINACIVACGGTLGTYNHNTGGIINALMDLQTAIAGMGGGSAVEIELTAAVDLAKGEAAYIDGSGYLAKAKPDGTRDEATIAGVLKEAVVANALGVLVFAGKVDLSGSSLNFNLTPGERYFLSGTGTISTTPASGTGEYVVLVGEALDSTNLALNIDVPVLLS